MLWRRSYASSGSWYSASINDALGDDAGWIAFPGGKADSGSAAANAVTAFGIPANAKNMILRNRQASWTGRGGHPLRRRN